MMQNKFICPKCKTEMKRNYKIFTAPAECTKCKIHYYYHFNKMYQNKQLIHQGSFAECCRIFNLKCFI